MNKPRHIITEQERGHRKSDYPGCKKYIKTIQLPDYLEEVWRRIGAKGIREWLESQKGAV